MLHMSEIVIEKPPLIKISLSILLSLSLAACASGSGKHQPRLSPGVLKAQAEQKNSKDALPSTDIAVEANPDQLRVTPEAELNNDPDLPLQDLDVDTLEKLLVMSLTIT